MITNRIRKISATTGIINTIAGNGNPGFSGDGGPALSATLYYPKGITIDGAGNIYFVDAFNQRVRKISATTGIITTIAGSGSNYGLGGDGDSATSATLFNPSSITIDSSGNLYFSDDDNSRIRRINIASGIISTVVGSGIRGYAGDGGNPLTAQINAPTGVAVDVSGRIYFSDAGNNVIRMVTDPYKILPLQRNRHKITIHSNQRVASLEMSKSEYETWIKNDDFQSSNKRNDLFKDIYSQVSDVFDFVFFVLPDSTIPEGINYFGLNIGVSNTTEGIGLPKYDEGKALGSAGKLKSIIQLPRYDLLMNGPSLHELAHTWGNFLLTEAKDWNGNNETMARPHFGFTGGNTKGQLGGFKQSTLKVNVDGKPNKFSVESFGGFANGGNGVPYNDLELYLMGLIPLTDVKEFDVFSGISQVTNTQTTVEFVAATRTTYNSARILAEAKTERVPSSLVSQKDFRALVMIITPKPLSDAQWNFFDGHAERLSRKADEGTSLYNFWEATRGLGSLQTDDLLNTLQPVNISASTLTVCAGSPVSFKAFPVNNGGVGPTYQWTKNNINIPGATSDTLILTDLSDKDSIRCKFMNSMGSSVSAPLVVNVSKNTIQRPTILSTTSAFVFCTGDSIILSASASTGNQWYLNDTAIDGAVNKSLIIRKGGTYKVIQTNAQGCVSTSLQTAVAELPRVTKPDIVFTRPLTFCAGDSVTLTSNSTQNNQWYLNDTTIIPGATNASYTVKTGGMYAVKVTNAGGCSAKSDNLRVIVNAVPPKPTITRVNADLLSNAPSGNQWYLDSVMISGANTALFRPGGNGYYKTKVTLNNCASEMSDPYFYLITALEPILRLQSDSYRIYPNPMVDILHIQTPNPGNPMRIILTDIKGSILLNKDFRDRVEIQVSALRPGIYTIQLTDKQTKEQISRKLIKH